MGTQATKGKSGSTSRLVDQGLLLDGIQNRFQRIPNREDETGGQLLQWPSGVHERG